LSRAIKAEHSVLLQAVEKVVQAAQRAQRRTQWMNEPFSRWASHEARRRFNRLHYYHRITASSIYVLRLNFRHVCAGARTTNTLPEFTARNTQSGGGRRRNSQLSARKIDIVARESCAQGKALNSFFIYDRREQVAEKMRPAEYLGCQKLSKNCSCLGVFRH
jgi:hypothetical protein